MGRSAQAAGVRSRWTTRGPQWGLGLAIIATGVSLGALAQAAITVSTAAHDTKLHPDYPDYISKQDCVDNTKITFSITGQTALANVQVWVSDYKDAKCWNTEYRDNQDTAKYCSPLLMSLNDNPVVIDAQTIIGHLRDANAGECTDTSSFAGHARQLYVFFIDTAEDKTDGEAGDKVYAVWDKGWVDLEGPAATNFDLGTGEESLIVRYKTSAAGSDVTKYSFYCAALPLGEGGACTPLPDLEPGKVPAAPGDCATDVSGPSGENTLKSLMNGTTYTVAMAALDKVDNLGPLSEFKCDTPEATESFFDAYRDAGGQAGGGCGLCSAGGDTRPGLPALAGGAIAFAVFAARRRRRRDIPRGRREAE